MDLDKGNSDHFTENEKALSFTELATDKEVIPTCYYHPGLYDHEHGRDFGEMSDRDFQADSESLNCEIDQEILNNEEPATKKFRHPDKHKTTIGIVEGTLFPILVNDKLPHSRPASPNCAYSDHFVTRPRTYAISGEIMVDHQSFRSEDKRAPRSPEECCMDMQLPPEVCSASDETREDFYVKNRKYTTSGRRHAICEELDTGVKTVRERSETLFDLREISDQLEPLTHNRKRKR